jgi:rhamnose utilization protein RhaD (predicted bifunctional aldolase and dehydrogenase)
VVSLERARDELVTLSRRLGEPAFDAVILGEGNASARVDDTTFLVKGSGCQLATLGPTDLVHLRFDGVMPLLQGAGGDLAAAYEAAKVDPAQARRPSIETIFHAACLSLEGVRFVAHSHPQAVNALTCSTGFPRVLEGRLFPDEAVVLGPASVFVPYLDPGVPLARAIHDGVAAYRRERGAPPKVVFMQNHGVIALGATAAEAHAITAMAIKSARIRLGALAAGGIAPLPESVVQHLIARPDEQFRQKMLTQ